MKKLLLIITLFIGLGNVNAQSDATLEETINWINEIALSRQINSEKYNVTSINIDSNKKQIIYSRTYDSEETDPVITKFNENTALKIYYNTYCSCYAVYVEISFGYFNLIRFSDKETAKRTYNAFDHLFKILNIEVRRENKLAIENKF
ncbi:hypothetical protein ACFQ5N_06715 [Lutibacter holmesii]|uniref:DUF4468 domain-containing protein n=1 Tax=Lutibacter holmesii TaxID=1137985 RepID=A0ABW3WNN3_9FLAO